jgi:hypothetical protein
MVIQFFFPVAIIKVTSDRLTNLYQLTIWLIHWMPRVQRRMHLASRTACGRDGIGGAQLLFPGRVHKPAGRPSSPRQLAFDKKMECAELRLLACR